MTLLQERGVDPQVVEYLKAPPSAEEISSVIALLGTEAHGLIRKGESVYKELGLKDADKATLVKAMAENPILIERPVVINGNKAAIGRPPEAVLDIL